MHVSLKNQTIARNVKDWKQKDRDVTPSVYNVKMDLMYVKVECS